MKNYCTYIRVSTQKQGKSGLGLDAQRKMCADFIAANGGTHVHEFIDVESGTHRGRKGLQDAITFCKQQGCPLVIAKLDRLARDVEFCFKVINTGIEIHFVDMPQINTLLLGVFASVAQYERELTSDRTKKALAVKKSQGCKLGAANEKYRQHYDSLTTEERMSIGSKRGCTRNKRHLESRDIQAMFRILRRVFPEQTKSDEPTDWDWKNINSKNGVTETIYKLMEDFHEMDETGQTFRRWTFDLTDKIEIQQKVGSYIFKIKYSINKSKNY